MVPWHGKSTQRSPCGDSVGAHTVQWGPMRDPCGVPGVRVFMQCSVQPIWHTDRGYMANGLFDWTIYSPSSLRSWKALCYPNQGISKIKQETKEGKKRNRSIDTGGGKTVMNIIRSLILMQWGSQWTDSIWMDGNYYRQIKWVDANIWSICVCLYLLFSN